MKKSIFAVVALAVIIAPITSLAADDGSFYIKGNAGIGMVLDSDINNLPDTDGTAEMSFENGFAVSIAAGYDFANPLRIEIESLIRENDLDGLSNNGLDIDFNEGDLFSRSIMLNWYYDLDTGSSWTPYAGVGFGGSRLELDVMGLDHDDNDPVFTYQFIGGVSYAFNEDLSVDAQYRYIGTGDATVNGADFDFHSNNLMLGLRYTF